MELSTRQKRLLEAVKEEIMNQPWFTGKLFVANIPTDYDIRLDWDNAKADVIIDTYTATTCVVA